MSATLRTNMVISIAGLGVAVGALASVVSVPAAVLFGVGLGVVVGGIFRAIGQVQAELKRSPSAS